MILMVFINYFLFFINFSYFWSYVLYNNLFFLFVF